MRYIIANASKIILPNGKIKSLYVSRATFIVQNDSCRVCQGKSSFDLVLTMDN